MLRRLLLIYVEAIISNFYRTIERLCDCGVTRYSTCKLDIHQALFGQIVSSSEGKGRRIRSADYLGSCRRSRRIGRRAAIGDI